MHQYSIFVLCILSSLSEKSITTLFSVSDLYKREKQCTVCVIAYCAAGIWTLLLCLPLSPLQCIRGFLKQYALQCESKKNPPPWDCLTFFPKGLGIFGPNFTCLLSVPIYIRLQIFIQLPATWRSYAILSASARPPSYAQNVHHRPKRTLGGRT